MKISIRSLTCLLFVLASVLVTVRSQDPSPAGPPQPVDGTETEQPGTTYPDEMETEEILVTTGTMEILVDASTTTPPKKGDATTAKKVTAPKVPPKITPPASKITTKQTTTTQKQTTPSASTTATTPMATTPTATTPTRTLTKKVSTIATPPAVETPTASSITESRATSAKPESKAPAKVTKSTKAPSARLTVPHGGVTTKGTVTQNSTNSGTGFLPGIDKDSFTAKVILPIAAGIVLAVFIVFIACSVRSCLDKDGKGSSSRRRLMDHDMAPTDRVMLLADSSEDEF